VTTAPNTRPGAATVFLTGGQDGIAPTAAEIEGDQDDKEGIFALEDADLFNLLCIPPVAPDGDTDPAVYTAALAYCKTRRALLLVDPRNSWATPAAVESDANNAAGFIAPLRDENAALYFPRVRMADALQENRLATFVPCGVVAGVIARTDAQRGVWKAPAGRTRRWHGVRELAYKMTDGENGVLNPLGVNCLRSLPGHGRVAWGARTCAGADRWLRRVEVRAGAPPGPLHRGEPLPRHAVGRLRAERRAAVGADSPQRRRVHAGPVPPGRVPGQTPRDAYLVKCDRRRRRSSTSTAASSTSSSASRRSSRPSSSSCASSRSGRPDPGLINRRIRTSM
jgi:hypothetical protein